MSQVNALVLGSQRRELLLEMAANVLDHGVNPLPILSRAAAGRGQARRGYRPR